jgi:hypothetical protein
MITCLDGLVALPALWMAIGVSAIAAPVLFWRMKFQKFEGKSYYSLTFVAMIWTLLMIGLEAASPTFACQLQWATLAWLGNGLVPVAWCFFVFAYIDNAAWLKTRRVGMSLVVVPIAIFLFAATNEWHNLVYTDASIIPPGEDYIKESLINGAGFAEIAA